MPINSLVKTAVLGVVVCILLSITITPPMHHSIFQVMGKTDHSGAHGPGLHLMPRPYPFCRAIHVKTALDVDEVTNIKVGAKDGTELTFSRIEIGNKPRSPRHIINLVDKYGEDWEKTVLYDQVHYIMSTVCSKMTSHEIAIEKFDKLDDELLEALVNLQKEWDTGVDILNVRVYKPKLPKALATAYALQAEEKALHKVEIEKNAKIKQQNLNTLLKAQGEHEVAAAKHQNQITMERNTHESQMKIQRERADTEAYVAAKKAESNSLLHTPEYIELKRTEALLKNAKIITGDSANALFAKLMDHS